MKKNLKFILFVFVSIILFIVSFLLFKKSMNNYTQDIINYNEVSSVDYKVYLKENSYFDSPYLDEGKVYITSLIDYIDVNFLYDLELDNNRSGKYIYYIKGVISANVSNSSKDYWQKSYDLVKSKEITYNDLKKISFNENIKIDYQKYNDLLLQFKEDFKLSMDGSFKIVLCIENYIESNEGYELKKLTTTNLEIPLTKATIEVPIEVQEVNKNDIIAGDLIYNTGIMTIIYKILCVFNLLLGLFVMIYSVIMIVRSFEKLSSYNKELRKILKTYDGIIVNISKLPSYRDYNLIDVNSFNELLDAHSEIRQPISYFESYKKATFTLINGNLVWRYVLKDKDYEEV